MQDQVQALELSEARHRQLEESLLQRTSELQAIFKAFPDLCFRLTHDGTILDYNVGNTSRLYLPPESFLNKRMQEVLPPEVGRLFQEAFRQVIETGTLTSLEYELPMPDGQRTYEARLLPLSEGEIIVVVRDMTERKKAEEEIRRLNEDLKRRATELETINKELEAFSYSVAHDLRTPLLLIGGHSRLLLEKYSGRLDDKGEQILGIIHSNAQRTWQLVEDLLHFSRLQIQEMNSSQIDMAHLAEAVIEELQLLHQGRTLTFHLHPLRPAWGDPTLIRQVLMNLLSNAIKFTGTKERAIIEVGCTADERHDVYYVRDNGIGFDMHDADKLYGAFQRLHPIGQFEGMGIGLAIVWRIVQRHGGWVWAEGKVNEGATFYFSLPRPQGGTGKEAL